MFFFFNRAFSFNIFCKEIGNLREIAAEVLKKCIFVDYFFALHFKYQSLFIAESSPRRSRMFKANCGSIEAGFGGFFNNQLCNA